MPRLRSLVVVAGAGAAAVALARYVQRSAIGHRAEGGVLIDDAAGYDRHTSRLMGSFYRSIANDVALAAPAGARVLEVGAGPGRLAILLAREHGLEVTALDLDPAMVERAQANAAAEAATTTGVEPNPRFVVGDVAALPFSDDSFDLVVSTMSMHHWADPAAGLAEIGRVLRATGRALVWDFRRGIVPFHTNVPDPVELAAGSSLDVASADSWRWPWRLPLTRRFELAPRPGAEPAPVG